MLFHKIFHEIVRPIQKINRLALSLKERQIAKRCGNGIVVDAAVYRGWRGGIISQNWGDDLNAHFLEPLFQRRMFFNQKHVETDAALPKEAEVSYQFIGSIISPLPKERKRIVWGSGLMRKLSGTENMGGGAKVSRGPWSADSRIPVALRMRMSSRVRRPRVVVAAILELYAASPKRQNRNRDYLGMVGTQKSPLL